jgi:hypothetical protein
MLCGLPQPLSCQEFCYANAGLLLEKVLQVGGTQVYFHRERLDRVKLLRLDHFDYFAQAPVTHSTYQGDWTCHDLFPTGRV